MATSSSTDPRVTAVDVAGNVRSVRARMAAAAQRVGRDPRDVVLVAAAKTKNAGLVEQALAAGVTDIGENYVQEAVTKRAAVHAAGRWHLIGHLQRNKATRAVEVFDVIQTVDSLPLATVVARHAAKRGHALPVLIEVNLAGESTKSGVAPSRLAALVVAVRQLDGVHVTGLMTIPPPGPPEKMRGYFRRLRELGDGLGVTQLSMGMTDDFEVAIEEGATIVRVGRAIFGER